MEYKYKVQESAFGKIDEMQKDYDVVVSIDKAADIEEKQLHVTHRIKLRTSTQNDYEETVIIGNWEFRNAAIFCYDSEAEQCRIDMHVQSIGDDSCDNFYIISPYLEDASKIADLFKDMITVIISCSCLSDFDNKSLSTAVSRINRPMVRKTYVEHVL